LLQLDFALLCIKAAMAWDEAMWGNEYDLVSRVAT
jgi:hypothetical protein